MSSTVRDAVLVVLLSSLVLFGNLGGAKLWDEDEPRNARGTAEMLERGDLIVPTFNGELRTHKPILLYWLMMAAYQVFGISEFAARFPSALCGVGTVVCVWLCGRRLFGARTALYSAFALSTALMFDVAARAATPDSVYIFSMTAAVTVFVLSTFKRGDTDFKGADDAVADRLPALHAWFPSTWLTVVGFYLCLGCAILAKGPVGFLLPMAIVGMFLLIMRRSEVGSLPPHHEQSSGPSHIGKTDNLVCLTEQDGQNCPSDSTQSGVRTKSRMAVGFEILRRMALWFAPAHFLSTLRCMKPLIGTILALLIAVPWYYAVGIATDGEWLRGFFLDHNLGRATRAMEHHSGPFLLYYIVAVMVGFFPWSVLLLPSILDARRRYLTEQKVNPGIMLAACWITVPVVLFSCASTKLPSYVTPGYPGLALLVGTFLNRLATGRAAIGTGWVRTAFGSALVVGVLIAVGSSIAMQRLFPGEYLLLVPGIVLVMGAAYSLHRAWTGRLASSIRAYAVGAAGFVICLFQVAAPRISSHQEIQSLLSAAPTANADFATFEVMQSSWVFYAGQTLERFDRNHLADMRTFLQADDSHFVIAKTSRVAELSEKLGISLSQLHQVSWFLRKRDQDLVLLSAFPPRHELQAAAPADFD